ncbi:hypothetical protein BKA81DRAFT_356831 [Phyllosticta paracitricarpa]
MVGGVVSTCGCGCGCGYRSRMPGTTTTTKKNFPVRCRALGLGQPGASLSCLFVAHPEHHRHHHHMLSDCPQDDATAMATISPCFCVLSSVPSKIPWVACGAGPKHGGWPVRDACTGRETVQSQSASSIPAMLLYKTGCESGGAEAARSRRSRSLFLCLCLVFLCQRCSNVRRRSGSGRRDDRNSLPPAA